MPDEVGIRQLFFKNHPVCSREFDENIALFEEGFELIPERVSGMEHQELSVFEADVGENALQVEGVRVQILEACIRPKPGVKMHGKPELSGL